MRGAPYDLSRTTLRPLGPSVTFTALARMSIPRSIRSRASPPNLTSFAAMICKPPLGSLLVGASTGAFNDAHNVGLLQDQKIRPLDLDLGARPFSEHA